MAQTKEDPEGGPKAASVPEPSERVTAAPVEHSIETSRAAPRKETKAGQSEPIKAEPVEESGVGPIEDALVEEIDTLQKFSDQQFEAATSTANSFAESFQLLTAEATDYSKKTFDNGSVFLKTLLGATSLGTIIDIQTSYTETAYATYLAHLVKMGDLYRNLLEAAAQTTGATKPRL